MSRECLASITLYTVMVVGVWVWAHGEFARALSRSRPAPPLAKSDHQTKVGQGWVSRRTRNQGERRGEREDKTRKHVKLSKASRALLRGLPRCTARPGRAKWTHNFHSQATVLAQLRQPLWRSYFCWATLRVPIAAALNHDRFFWSAKNVIALFESTFKHGGLVTGA